VRRAISIQDIARAANVSHATVSRALHDSPLISTDVRERIQRLAREMGYTPNAVAQSLKSRQTRAIGLVVTSISDPFVGLVVRGIEEVAQTANMGVFLSVSHNDPEREMQVIEMFRHRRVDGIISAAAQLTDRYSAELAGTGLPTVLINQQAETDSGLLHSVNVDDYSGARLAVAHLIKLGHTRIGYIGAGNRPRSNHRRLAGYRDALGEAGIPVCETYIGIADAGHKSHAEDVADGQALLPKLLRAGTSAVFCFNDMIAVGVLLACRERGLVVPRDLSVAGFDDVDAAQYVTPPLTTIRQPKLELGRAAMDMLLKLLNGSVIQDRVLAAELIVRGSTGPEAEDNRNDATIHGRKPDRADPRLSRPEPGRGGDARAGGVD
jgi:LacI family transcriptional regulator/LacI family repressor for deo operon, udp, cdd, tsx, nupC, and nupG